MRDGGSSAGSSRVVRLDPHALPVRFWAKDAAADGRLRQVELHRERVVVRRSLSGMRMALNMPMAAFAGVGLTVTMDEGGAAVAVVLAHEDKTLNLPLFLAPETDDALAEWRSWGEVLGLPLLLTDDAGDWRKVFMQLGALRIGASRPRRRRRSALRKRRPAILMRRAPGKLTAAASVYRGEREIIARN